MTKPKKTGKSKLMDEAWKWFSLFIRLKDTNDEGIGQCISCRKYLHYKNGQAGHYISRRHNSTLFDEQNVHLQCPQCNGHFKGNLDEYAISLIQKYGQNILEDLNIRKRLPKKFTSLDLAAIVQHYKSAVKELEKNKLA
jgi:hypothetical protein